MAFSISPASMGALAKHYDSKGEFLGKNLPKEKRIVPTASLKSLFKGKPYCRIPVEVADPLTGEVSHFLAPPCEYPVARVAAIINDVKTVSGQFGDAARFLGQCLFTSEFSPFEVEAGAFFLPGSAEQIVLTAFNEAKKNDGFAGMQVVFDVLITPAQKLSDGNNFSYGIVLVGQTFENPVRKLLAEIPAPVSVFALPAPTEPETVQAEPEKVHEPKGLKKQ